MDVDLKERTMALADTNCEMVGTCKGSFQEFDMMVDMVHIWVEVAEEAALVFAAGSSRPILLHTH